MKTTGTEEAPGGGWLSETADCRIGRMGTVNSGEQAGPSGGGSPSEQLGRWGGGAGGAAVQEVEGGHVERQDGEGETGRQAGGILQLPPWKRRWQWVGTLPRRKASPTSAPKSLPSNYYLKQTGPLLKPRTARGQPVHCNETPSSSVRKRGEANN